MMPLSMILKYAIQSDKPEYQVAWAVNVFRGRVLYRLGLAKPVFRSIDFATTYACNFKCEHCYAKQLVQKDKPLMSVEDYRNVVAQAMAMGARGFSFQGGEIFLRKDWREIILASQPKLNHITVTTNGTILTEQIIKELAELGNDTVYFSMDSGFAIEHDKFRHHQGCFDYMLKMMELVERYKMKVAINCCVWKGNLYTEGFRMVLEFAKKKGYMVETIYARPLGSWEGKTDVTLSDEDMAYFNQFRKDYPMAVRDLDNNYGVKGCPALKEVVYITPYGDVCACPYNHISLGNIKNESLSVIRDRGLTMVYGRDNPVCLTAEDKDFMKWYDKLISDTIVKNGKYPTYHDIIPKEYMGAEEYVRVIHTGGIKMVCYARPDTKRVKKQLMRIQKE
jgi:MoaA/NifB/PqqE/SkfB family radical SAM enzyme